MNAVVHEAQSDTSSAVAYEAERYVLGALLMVPSAIEQLSAVLTADDFEMPFHQQVFRAALACHAAGELPEAITLMARMKSQGVPNPDPIWGLWDEVQSAVHILHYASVVATQAKTRRVVRQLAVAHQVAAGPDLDMDAKIEMVRSTLADVERERLAVPMPAVGGLLPEWYTAVQQASDAHTGITGVPTGFRALDAMTLGLQSANLVIVASRPRVGKTSMALNMALRSARIGTSVGIFSLEMSQRELLARLVATQSNVDSQLFTSGRLSAEQWERVNAACETLSHLPIAIDDSATLSMAELRARAMRAKSERGIDLLIVDYLQLIAGGERFESRTQEVSAVSRGLKALARELGIPVLALAQLNRRLEYRGENARPMLSDLRECVVGSTQLIDAKTGVWKPIREMKAGDMTFGVDEHQRIVAREVEHVWCTGMRDVFCVRTSTGRELTATDTHPLLTPTGWHALQTLHPGDVIATACRLPAHGKDTASEGDLCRLLGYMAGNGTAQRQRAVGFITNDDVVLDDVVQIIGQRFPEITVREKPARGTWHDLSFSRLYSNGYGQPYGNPLREWLRMVDAHGVRDATKHVSDFVFQSGTAGAAEFLAGYFATDGCITKTGEIRFDTVSCDLAYGVQALLLRLGIVATVDAGRMYRKSTRPIYRMKLSQAQDNLRRFIGCVPVRGRKCERLAQLMAEPERRKSGSNLFALPREVSTYASTVSRWRDQGKRMHRDICHELAGHTRNTRLLQWAESDLLWEEIQEITPEGRQEVFDVVLPSLGNFLANGIVAHNSGSIEQEADLVMFLHRTTDEQGHPHVQLLIEKHRNGPTGEIALHFEPRTTAFGELATQEIDAFVRDVEAMVTHPYRD